ncbi:GGDEF domain-containing protein [Belnapia sp. F-4-1]|uniref:GGDEF domain-containing protein n=1 Tax=Belnapia sp. F-4-1 TaxID=1545443 RepID=UPI0005BE41B0|nr:GGDEF domain-containing protein [Belnapia sp. F-4-1]
MTPAPLSDDPNGRHRDPMTGAVTEEALLHFLEAVLAMAEPVGPQVGMLCLGIDGLDGITARHGTAVRDAALLGVADRMHERIRVQDLVGRVDGGFGVCLADIFPAQAVAAAERLLRCIRAMPVPTPIGALALTCSVGLVLSRGGTDQAPMLLDRARDLREAARRSGGDSLVTSLQGRPG